MTPSSPSPRRHAPVGAARIAPRAAGAPRPPAQPQGLRLGLVLAAMGAGVTGAALQAPAGAVRADAPVAVVVAKPRTAAAEVRLAQANAAPASNASTDRESTGFAAAGAPAGLGRQAAPAATANASSEPLQQVAHRAAPAPTRAGRASFPLLGDGHRGDAFAPLRAQLRWVPVRVGARRLATPDPQSRLLLAHSAAQRAGLHKVGLDFRDVYGVISAESSWVPRTGMGKNGVASHGLAQFEPATARAVGLSNPNDPVEAVHAAAEHLKEAARWSARRIAPLKLSPQEHAVKLREGVSIYYNLSSKSRAAWRGTNTHQLPVETRLHIRNVRTGAQQAERLSAGLGLEQLATPLQWDRPSAPAGAPQQVASRQTGGGEGRIAWSDGGGGRRVWTLPNGQLRSAGDTGS